MTTVDEVEVIQPSRYDKLHEYLKQADKEGRAAILMQPNPDPDALGSGLAFQWLLETKYGIQSDLFSIGEVSHPQNQTAINVLDIRVQKKDLYSPETHTTAIVVDTVPQNTGFEDVVPKFHIVLDHHQFDIDTDIVDIRSVGACSTIVWDYLQHYKMDFDSDVGKQVATALLLGIRNDTAGLLSENTSTLDMKAHAELMSWVDRKKLQEIIQYSYPTYLYELRSLAFESRVVKDSVLISGLGILTSKKRDAMPIIADEFIRIEGVETVVVLAIVGDSIEASVRSRNSSLNVHDFCQKIFGMKFAGGKPGSGGARVPLGFLYSASDSEELRSEVCLSAQKILTHRILNHLLG